jgi:hypothetical protein
LNSPVFHLDGKGGARLVQWPNEWQPIVFSRVLEEGLPIAGFSRVGSFLWEWSAFDGAAPKRFLQLEDDLLSGEGPRRLIRADGLYFWNALRWVAVEAFERVNFAAMRAVFVFCHRRNIGDMRSVEGRRGNWRELWKAARA